MAKSAPLRIDDEVYLAAKAVGDRLSRSAAEQVSHWAKLGRALEASDVTVAELESVLSGRLAYDDADGSTQVLVRAAWKDRMGNRLVEIDLAGAVEDDGGTAVWMTDDGRMATRSLTDPSPEGA